MRQLKKITFDLRKKKRRSRQHWLPVKKRNKSICFIGYNNKLVKCNGRSSPRQLGSRQLVEKRNCNLRCDLEEAPSSRTCLKIRCRTFHTRTRSIRCRGKIARVVQKGGKARSTTYCRCWPAEYCPCSRFSIQYCTFVRRVGSGLPIRSRRTGSNAVASAQARSIRKRYTGTCCIATVAFAVVA